MKLIKEISKIVSNIEGSLIGIGIEEEIIINKIEKNKKIVKCDLLNCYTPDSTEKGKLKKIKIRKLRKKFKKNKTNYIIYNFEKVCDFKEKFIYDSIYICNREIYIYNKSLNIESTIRKYSRFCKITEIKCDNGIIYKIEQFKKMNKLNELTNKIKDYIIDSIDFISNMLS